MEKLLRSLSQFPILPVVKINKPDYLEKIVEYCIQQDLHHLEITLRSDCALQSIERIKGAYPQLVLGAGTILNEKQFAQAQQAGADFFISPGISPGLCQYARQHQLNYIPGVASASEIMLAMEYDLKLLKLFPAEPNGLKILKAFAGPFYNIKFCATGGINFENMGQYLSLSNVACVGSSGFLAAQIFDQGNIELLENNFQRAKATLASTIQVTK